MPTELVTSRWLKASVLCQSKVYSNFWNSSPKFLNPSLRVLIQRQDLLPFASKCKKVVTVNKRNRVQSLSDLHCNRLMVSRARWVLLRIIFHRLSIIIDRQSQLIIYATIHSHQAMKGKKKSSTTLNDLWTTRSRVRKLKSSSVTAYTMLWKGLYTKKINVPTQMKQWAVWLKKWLQ